MKHKKLLVIAALSIAFISSTTAVEVLDIALEPDEPRFNDSMDVVAYVDGEGTDINSVDLDVRENDDLIVNDEPMEFKNGDEEDISSWELEEAINVTGDDSEDVTYDLSVQAIDVEGENSDNLLSFTVDENETVVDEPTTDPDNDNDYATFYGFTLLDIAVFIAVLAFIYAVFIDE